MNLGVITNTNAKGQVVIPKKYRDELEIDENVKLNIVLRDDGVFLSPLTKSIFANLPSGDYDSLDKVLEMTQGAWKHHDWAEYDRLEKKRRKFELKASKARKNAW